MEQDGKKDVNHDIFRFPTHFQLSISIRTNRLTGKYKSSAKIIWIANQPITDAIFGVLYAKKNP